MFCSTCGNNYDDSAAFCPVCGAANQFGASQDATTVIGESTVAAPATEILDAEPQTTYVAPQPAFVAPQTEYSPQPAYVAPQPEVSAQPAYVAPQPEVSAQPAYVAPQPEVVTPVAEPAKADKPKKKSKKPIIITSIVVVAVLGLVALFLFVIGPAVGINIFSTPYEDISNAVRKTMFENSGMEFTIKVNGDKVSEGAISIGDSLDDTGFYSINSGGYGSGLADKTAVTPYGEEKMPDDYWEMLDERFDSMGADIDSEETVKALLNNKIEEEKLKELYNDNRSVYEDMFEEETGEKVSLPEWDEVQGFLQDFVKDGLDEEAIVIEKSKEDGNKIYSYEIDCEKLAECFYEFAKNDERAEGVLEFLALVYGFDDIDEMEDIIDEAEGDIKGEIIINKEGYLVEVSAEFDGDDEIVFEFSKINDTEVTLDTVKDKVKNGENHEYAEPLAPVEPDYNYDYDYDYDAPVEVEPDYVEPDYDYDYEYEEPEYVEPEYVEPDYNYDDYAEAYINADVASLSIARGDTASILVDCWGNDLPENFEFYVEYPGGTYASWGEWETSTSCYLYLTGEEYCDGYVTLYLRDSAGNNLDIIQIPVEVY